VSAELLYLGPEHLSPAILCTYIYPDLDHDYYWSDCWSARFYAGLASAGFIPIADRTHSVLIPEMQKSYAVLDWKDLHVSGHLRKIIRMGRLIDDEVYLTVEKNTDSVVNGIRKAYGEQCWLIEPYGHLLKELETFTENGFSLVSVQLWSGRLNSLLGGELGYGIGETYTSLSGFLDRSTRMTDNLGTVQLLSLARLLERSGYAFWNLGQPFMQYKIDLGAKVTPRLTFLKRFLPAGMKNPTVPLTKNVGTRFYGQDLLAMPASAKGVC
jgi:Leu/Phe-tRNA-protein transferase